MKKMKEYQRVILKLEITEMAPNPLDIGMAQGNNFAQFNSLLD